MDSTGAAYLPLKSGAKRIYVNNLPGYGGSDSNSGLSPASPVLTSAKAHTLRTDGSGDQILFAWGGTWLEEPPHLRFKTGGYSLRYPGVVGAYDPTDPTNETKIRQGPPTQSQKPVFSWDATVSALAMGGTVQKYFVYKNFHCDPVPGGVSPSGQSLTFVAVSGGFLWENISGPHYGLTVTSQHQFDDNIPFEDHWIVRRCGLSNTYDTATGTNGSLTYMDGCLSLTMEGNVLHGAGYKDKASRNLSMASGGGNQFRHALYQQDGTAATTRFNLITSPCADAGSHRGSSSDWYGVHMDAPISLAYGDGTLFNTNKHTRDGNRFDSRYMACVGSSAVTPGSGAAGWGIKSLGGIQGSGSYDCILTGGIGSFSGNVALHKYDYAPNGWNETDSDLIHSYHEFNGCVFYSWSTPGNSMTTSADYFTTAIDPTVATAKIHLTANNNAWDSTPSGTNVSVSSVTYANPLTTLNGVATAAGFADYDTMVAYALAHSGEITTCRTLLSILFGGFNKTIDTVAPTLMVSAVAGSAGAATVTVNTSKRGGLIHAVAVPNGATAPTADQIRGRSSATWDRVANGAWGLVRVVQSGNQTIALSGLSAGAYDVYAVCDYYCTLSSVVSTTVTVS